MRENLFLAGFLPGLHACRRAQLVLCNGGSPAAYQALSVGAPVLGIASNMDQLLNMQAVERKGAGILIRPGQLTSESLKKAAAKLIESPEYRLVAKQIAEECSRFQASSKFAELVSKILPGKVKVSKKHEN